MKNLIFSITLFLVLSACKKEDLNALSTCNKEELNASETIMRVNYYRQSCQGEGVFNCYLTQEGDQVGTNKWNLFYNQIEGFQYEEGFVYTLKVRIEKVENPLEDMSSRKYILVKLVSKKKA